MDRKRPPDETTMREYYGARTSRNRAGKEASLRYSYGGDYSRKVPKHVYHKGASSSFLIALIAVILEAIQSLPEPITRMSLDRGNHPSDILNVLCIHLLLKDLID